MQTYVNTIKQLIKNQGLTQLEFIQKLGVTKDTFYQQMRANSISISTLQRYADALNVPLWRLFVSEQEIKGYKEENHTAKSVCVCPKCGAALEVRVLNDE